MLRSVKISSILCVLMLITMIAVQSVAASVVLADIQQGDKLELNCKYPVLTSEGTISFTYEIEVLYSGEGNKKTFDLNAKVPSEFKSHSVSSGKGIS